MTPPPWVSWEGEGPLVAVALHHGHDLRDEVAQWIALDDDERWREEDPFTGAWATIAETGFVVSRSRFEVDLNRPRELAIYQTPEQAWGLNVWRGPLPLAVCERSLELYDRFYASVEGQIQRLLRRHPRVVVLDLHTYNHRRDGATARPAPAAENPDWNVGTGSLDRSRFGSLVDRFLRDLARDGGSDELFDARENVRFRGGHFTQWLNGRFPGRVCALAVECKKFFMDEWTATVSAAALDEPRRVLAATIPGLLEELRCS